MGESLLGKFVEIFVDLDCDDQLIIQNAINDVRKKYVPDKFGAIYDEITNTSRICLAKEQYYRFYEKINKDTSGTLAQYSSHPVKTLNDLSAKYFTNFNNKFAEGNANKIHAFTLYFWFHNYAEDKQEPNVLYVGKEENYSSAEQIDKAIWQQYHNSKDAPDFKNQFQQKIRAIREEFEKLNPNEPFQENSPTASKIRHLTVPPFVLAILNLFPKMTILSTHGRLSIILEMMNKNNWMNLSSVNLKV